MQSTPHAAREQSSVLGAGSAGARMGFPRRGTGFQSEFLNPSSDEQPWLISSFLSSLLMFYLADISSSLPPAPQAT